MAELRHRVKEEVPSPDAGAGATVREPQVGPPGQKSHGIVKQILLLLAFVLYFSVGCICIHATQLLGSPLYFINKDYFYAYMAFTKQCFGLLINSVTQWFAPTPMLITGDESVRGQLRKTKDGRLECDFPERAILIANHQIYTDWLYLWWISYTSRLHGHIFIILKESLKYIPFIGPGMMFYGFIFLARNWTKDKPVFHRAMERLKTRHGGPLSGSGSLDPMWLLIFPEGTNLCANGRTASKKWADKTGQSDMKHQLLPRTTGLRFCLQELRGTVDWVYDCTIAYEGVPHGTYGQDIYTLWSMYIQGRYPRSVSLHWRRFATSSIPVDDEKAFEAWLRARWEEKDELLERYLQHGSFPSDDEATLTEANGAASAGGDKKMERKGSVETLVRSKSQAEYALIFAPAVVYGALFYGLYRGVTALVG